MAAFTHGRGIFATDDFACNNPGNCYGNDLCRIENIAMGQQVCNEATGTYSQDVFFVLYNTPSSGTLTVNGQNFAFPFSASGADLSVTLTGLIADGNPVDLEISFSDAGCGIVRAGAFTAPADGCLQPNDLCIDAFEITGTATYETNGPSSGGGCEFCENSSHADWWKFTAPCNGSMSIESCLQGVDTRVIIHTGNCEDLTFLTGNDDLCELTPGGNAWASQLTGIPVTEGTTYFIEWDNRWSSDGFSFNFIFTPTGACGDPSGCEGQNYIVVEPSASGDGSGCDWDNAVTDLNIAIGMAGEQQNIAEIWIKEGIYRPEGSGRNSSFEVDVSVELIGGFVGTETNKSQRDPANHVTYLNGNIGSPQSETDNVYHVVEVSGDIDAVITDIVIEDGYADGIGDLAHGGGIFIGSNITMTDVQIRNCYASGSGSAIFIAPGNATIILEDVDCIEGNTGPTCAQFEMNGNITIKGQVDID